MPELPDVEEQIKLLKPWLKGKQIAKTIAPASVRQRGGFSERDFISNTQKKTIESLSRKGKWILVRFRGEGGMAIHLGMTGYLTHSQNAQAENVRASFKLNDKSFVHFQDSRMFGKILTASRFTDLLKRPALTNLGPDALKELSLKHLEKILHSSARIKIVLMDQKNLTGLGNVYTTEALWFAKIFPGKPANKVVGDKALVKSLFKSIRLALRRGMDSYKKHKEMQTKVYGRVTKPCPRCKTPLKAITIAQRTSTFCPECQKP